MGKKKIIIVGSAYPFRGGLASYNERLAKEFISIGHDVRIATFTVQYPSILFPGKSQFATNSEAPDNINITRSVNSVNPINWLRVGHQLKKEKPDLLIIKFWLPFMGPCFGTIARIVKKNRHTKVLCIVDNMIPHEKRMGDKIFTRYFAKAVDGFVAMSQKVYDDIALFNTRAPRKLSPHPMFDNFGEILAKQQAKEKLGISIQHNYLLFFGLIRKYKGLDLLLKAFSKLDRKRLNIKLIIAGEFYTDEKPYRTLLEELELQEDVILRTHFIPDDEVASYFCAADIVVQPYLSATQSGVSQIAYHFNKPMLVTNVGGIPETVPHGKVGYVSNIDDEEVANHLRDFYENSKEEFFIANIQEEKVKYQWDTMVNSLLDINKEL